MTKGVEWIKIFSTTNEYEAKILEAKLIENGFAVQLVNRQESAYVQFNQFLTLELFVPQDDALNALQIINQHVE